MYLVHSSFVPNTKLPMIRDGDDDGGVVDVVDGDDDDDDFLRCVCVVCNAHTM